MLCAATSIWLYSVQVFRSIWKQSKEQEKVFEHFVIYFPGVWSRCDGYHLCGGEQQLQHGDQRRQSDQQTTGGSQSFQEHLEQQVSKTWAYFLLHH